MKGQRSRPYVIVIAGPNGAGKSTAAPFLLNDSLQVAEFVNADTIAAGLSAFRPATVALTAGRIMLARMRQLARRHDNFGFETTLASRSFVPWLRSMQREGYHVHLVFLWLRTPELAINRILDRVRAGGHGIPTEVVTRRYEAGLRNLFKLYLSLANSWQIFDNSETGVPSEIARGTRSTAPIVTDAVAWRGLKELYDV